MATERQMTQSVEVETGTTISDTSPPAGAPKVGGCWRRAAAACSWLVGDANVALEVLSGITVSLALVPESVAFGMSSGLTAAIGLNSAWIIAVGTALLGGRPAGISGATGSIAVLIGDMVRDHGPEYIFWAVMLMGIIQMAFGLLRGGALVKLVPASVMIGFCNGLAVVIGLAQFENFKVPGASGSNHGSRRLSNFDAFSDGEPFVTGEIALFAGIITAISFCVSLFLPKLTQRVPSALVAIALGTAFEWCVVRPVGSSTTLVRDVAALDGSFVKLVWCDTQYQMPSFSQAFGTVLPLAIRMAAFGLLESLMTLNLIDEITKTPGNPTRECLGLGVSNLACGMLGGMGGCAMLGQAMINVGSGARTRISSATSGVVLLLFVVCLYSVINILPVSALAGVMFTVVYHTFEWGSLTLVLLAALPLRLRERCFSPETSKKKIRRVDALVIVLVTLVTIFSDLAFAVVCGVLLACLMFVYDCATLITVNSRDGADATTGSPVKYYDVHGILFFGSAANFLALFDEAADPDDVRLVFDAGYIADYSAIEALNKLGERYGALGKRVTLQELKPGSSRIVSKSAGLLVQELAFSLEAEEVLPTQRSHLHVEGAAGPAHGLLDSAESAAEASQSASEVDDLEGNC